MVSARAQELLKTSSLPGCSALSLDRDCVEGSGQLLLGLDESQGPERREGFVAGVWLTFQKHSVAWLVCLSQSWGEDKEGC